jgi:hypothetical protein
VVGRKFHAVVVLILVALAWSMRPLPSNASSPKVSHHLNSAAVPAETDPFRLRLLARRQSQRLVAAFFADLVHQGLLQSASEMAGRLASKAINVFASFVF